METFSKEQSEHIYYIDLAKAKSEGSICVLLILLLKTKRGGEEASLFVECDKSVTRQKAEL